jgi:hypothetical protein
MHGATIKVILLPSSSSLDVGGSGFSETTASVSKVNL